MSIGTAKVAALSIHYRGGRSRGTNLMREINGAEGNLQLTADGGQAQIGLARDEKRPSPLPSATG